MKFCFETKKYVYISFHCWWNELFSFHLLIYYLCFYKIFACADISFRVISFQVVPSGSFVTRNEISFPPQWPQWNKPRVSLRGISRKQLRLGVHQQQYFSTQPQCCLIFSWTFSCCLIHITITKVKRFSCLLQLSPCLDVGLFMSYLCDFYFHLHFHYD